LSHSIRAQAKVNLRLKIFPRRSDGFHPLETIFCRIDLADELLVSLRKEPGVSIRVSGHARVPEGPDNIAVRAATLFLDYFGCEGGVDIELEKRIPAGSGLGGGSSDAAAVLRLLSQLTESTPLGIEVMELAVRLGSDVAFFAADTALAGAVGRGERLVSTGSLEPRPLLLMVPDAGVSTEDAYAWWDQANREASMTPPAEPSDLAMSGYSSWDQIRSVSVNDFEPVVFARLPLLDSLHRKLQETEPLIARLSGSGSTLFGVYESDRQRDDASSWLEAELEGVQLISARGPV